MGNELQQPPREQDASLKVPTTPEGIEARVEPTEDVDPALADWLRVDIGPAVTEDSATELESDVDSLNEDVGNDTDEWIDAGQSETLDSFQVLVSTLTSTSEASGSHVLLRVVSSRRDISRTGIRWCLFSDFVVDDE